MRRSSYENMSDFHKVVGVLLFKWERQKEGGPGAWQPQGNARSEMFLVSVTHRSQNTLSQPLASWTRRGKGDKQDRTTEQHLCRVSSPLAQSLNTSFQMSFPSFAAHWQRQWVLQKDPFPLYFPGRCILQDFSGLKWNPNKTEHNNSLAWVQLWWGYLGCLWVLRSICPSFSLLNSTRTCIYVHMHVFICTWNL